LKTALVPVPSSSDAVAKASADGYTILMGSVATTTFPAGHANLPYDLVHDLAPRLDRDVPSKAGLLNFANTLERVLQKADGVIENSP
jgi:hypothetical protein